MSRSFSLLLIALGVAVLGSLIYLHFYLMERQHTELFEYSHTVNERVIEQKRREINMLHGATQEFFLDEVYARRSFVLDIFTEAELRLETYFDSLNTLDAEHPDQWPDIRDLAKLALSSVIDTAVAVFRQHHLQADMREEDMLTLVTEFEEMQHGVHCTLNHVAFPSPAFRLEREVITLELLADVHDVLHRVASMSCYRGCYIDAYFPVMTSAYSEVRSGDIVNTQVGIGSYTTKFGHDNSVIVVDGDTLTLCEDGLADFSFKSVTLG